MKQLLMLSGKLSLKWEMERSPYIVGILHDLCKCDSYTKTGDGYKYCSELTLNGHGDKSVIVAQQVMAESGLKPLTEEEILCIRWHMGAFDEKSNWNSYSASVRKYPNVLYAHTADMLAAHVSGI